MAGSAGWTNMASPYTWTEKSHASSHPQQPDQAGAEQPDGWGDGDW